MRSTQVNFGLGGVETGVCVSVVTWVRMFEHDTGGIPDFLISNSILHQRWRSEDCEWISI